MGIIERHQDLIKDNYEALRDALDSKYGIHDSFPA